MKVLGIFSISTMCALVCKASSIDSQTLGEGYFKYEENVGPLEANFDSFLYSPCQDQTLDIFNTILSFKFNLNTIEKGVADAFSGFRGKLQGKEEFSMLDIFGITADYLRSFNMNLFNISDMNLRQRVTEMKTLYVSTPILQHGVNYAKFMIKSSSNNTDLNEFFREGKQMTTKLISTNPVLGSMGSEISRIAASNETTTLLQRLRSHWANASPLCITNAENAGADTANVMDAFVALSPSPASDTQAPVPGNVPITIPEQIGINASKLLTSNATIPRGNDTSNVSTAVTYSSADSSSGIASHRMSSWSIMGAVVVALSSVLLF